MSKVERCDLAPGLNISRIVTGLWQIADLEREGKTLDPDATAETMDPYIAAGLTTFDMADHYGSAEVIAGHLTIKSDDNQQPQVLTKWVPAPGEISKKTVVEAVQRSLDRLQTDIIDLLQFHAWNYADPAWLDCLLWLQELKEDGQIAHLGLTNFDAAHLDMVGNSDIQVVSNQICFSLIDQRPKNDMTAVCVDHNIKLLAYGTLAGGFLTDVWLDKTQPEISGLETWSQMKYFRFIEAGCGWDGLQAILKTAQSIAEKHGVTIANVACRTILEQPEVAGIIVGARLGHSEHIAENMRLFDFTLDAEDHTALRKVLDRLDPVPGDSGDEYRRPPYLTAAGDLSHHFPEAVPPYQPQEDRETGRIRVSSGTIWEDIAGFSRAVRVGNRILVSGTTATHESRAIGGHSAAAQLHFIIDKIEGAIQSLGGRLEDVVRTRIYISRQNDWEAVSRVHGLRFRHIRPTNTLVQAGLIGDEYLVEMEAEAVVKPD